MNTTWDTKHSERWTIAVGKEPIICYLNTPTRYAVFDKGSRIKGYVDGNLPLPYTAPMLTRRQERGADVPEFWRARVIEVVQPVETKVA